jgi:hypothetical protein
VSKGSKVESDPSKGPDLEAEAPGKRKWKRSTLPWRVEKSGQPGPGTYSIERAKATDKNAPHWSFYGRREIKRVHMPWFPEKDFGKFDTPYYDEYECPSRTVDFHTSESGRECVMYELVGEVQRPLRDVRNGKTPAPVAYGIPNDECRKDKHHGYTCGLADRGKFGIFDALEKTPAGVGPGLYKVNEVLTTRRVRAPGMGNTWKSFEKVQSPGLEATLLCKASPGHEYTPQVCKDGLTALSETGTTFSKAITGRHHGTKAPMARSTSLSELGPPLEAFTSLRSFSTRSLNPPGGSWPEVRDPIPTRLPIELAANLNSSTNSILAYPT